MQKQLFLEEKICALNKYNRLKPIAAFIFIFLFSFLPFHSFAQNQTNGGKVSGVVVDDDNLPMPGVNIYNTKTKQTITSGDKGEFSINVSDFPVTLNFTMVGYAKQDLTFNKTIADLKVKLVADNKLNEVIVVGYGTTTRLKNTGSVAKVSGETLVQQPISNPVLGMQGRVAGVYMTTASGDLGANVNVAIRGTNTIASSSRPLYIIDGVPMPSTGINNSAYGGATGPHSPFMNVNSADIESMEVLKDADATAIYGSRGANGVILITTKKGKGGSTKVSADFYKGYQNAVNKLNLLNTKEYIQMRRDAFAADGITNLTMTNAYDILLWGDQRYTDMQDLLFGKTADVTDAQFSVQGGNQNTQYIFGVGYRDDNGVLMGKNNQRRGSARLNINHTSSNNKFTLNSTINYSSTKMSSIGTSGFSFAWIAPNMPLLDEVTGLPYFYGTASNAQSPLKYTYSDTNLSNFNFIGAATLGYRILPNLQVKLDASFTRLDYRGVEKYRGGYLNPNEGLDYKNFATFGNDYQHTYNIEPQLNYNTKIGKGKLTALLGGTFQETIQGGQVVQGRNFSSELLMGALAAAGTIPSYSTSYNQYKFNSIFGRVTYDFDNKYVLNGTFRRDGSSRFGPARQFGNFWAIGGAWIASNESFIRDNFKFVSLAKLRSSYGLTGNDGIGNYQFMETFGATSEQYNFNSGLYATRLGNPDFSWETNKKFEVAAELNFFNNRITTTTAFFSNISGNQLVNYPIAGQTGWTSYVANLDAKIRNRGFEFETTTTNINGKDFKWRTNFNITTFRNTLLAFPNLAKSSYSNTYEIGKSINVYRRYEFVGIDPATGTPLVKDLDGNGAFAAVGDYRSYGDSDARFYGGLGNTFNYKGFELDVFFQFTKRPYANAYINSSNTNQPGIIFNQPDFVLDGIWRKPGDIATKPRLSTVNSGAFNQAYSRYRLSDAGITDASYIRLKNVSFSYTLPSTVVNKLKLSNVRVYALGQNLWTITNYKGFDPETPGTSTPPMRTLTFGINVSL
jgi:TonB-linked SusC/RagA family outer membrane protein